MLFGRKNRFTVALFLWVVCSVGGDFLSIAHAAGGVPRFLYTPTKYAVEGQFMVDSVEIWGADWRAEHVEFRLKQAPSSMRIASIGRRGCCSWKALITWRPEQKDTQTTHTIEIEAKPSMGPVITRTYTLHVVPHNDPPRFASTPSTYTLPVEQSFRYPIKVLDPEVASHLLNVRILQAPSGVQLDSKQILTWTPSWSDLGRHSVLLEVTDGQGGRAVQSFALQVQSKPVAPSFLSTPVRYVQVDQLYTYQLRTHDPNRGDTTTYRLRSGPTGMTVGQDGLIQWKPTQTGTFSIHLEASDASGQKNAQSWSLHVVAATQNKAPTLATQLHWSAHEGSPWKQTLLAQDPDQDSLTYALVQAPLGMTIQPKQGGAELHWTPPSNSAGRHRVIVRVEDGKGGVVRTYFSVHVHKRAASFKITSNPQLELLQDQLWSYSVHVTPTSSQSQMRFALNTAPSGVQINPATGQLVWKPTARDVGKHTIEIAVRNTQGVQQTQRCIVQVFDVNDAPRWTHSPNLKVQEGHSFHYPLLAVDPDGNQENLAFRILRSPPRAQLDHLSQTLTWNPGPNDIGKHVFELEVYDTRGGRTRQHFVLEVTNTNNPPQVISKPLKSAQVGQLYVYVVRAYDPDAPFSNETVRFSLLGSPPKGMKIGTSSGILTWLPQESDANVEHEIKVLVRDAHLGESEHSFSIRVFSKNQRPEVIIPATLSIQEGVLFKYTLRATDPDQDALRFVLERGPKGLTLGFKDGRLEWRPRAWDVGPQNVQLRVEDGKGGVVHVRLTLEVKNRNSRPYIVTRPLTQARAGALYRYVARAFDPDGQAIVWSLKKWPKGMTLEQLTGSVQWTPTAQQSGLHEVILEASDKEPSSQAVQRFWIEVHAQPQAPTFVHPKPGPQAIRGKSYHYVFQATDPNPKDALRFSLVTGPSGMSIHAQTGLLSWVPTEAHKGSFFFQVRACDPKGLCVDTRHSISVVAHNRPPRFISTPVVYTHTGQIYVYVYGAIDPDGDPVTVELIRAPKPVTPQSRMQLNTVRSRVEWIPANGHQNKEFIVTLKASDSHGASVFQSYRLHVSAQKNAVPVWKNPLPSSSVQVRQGQLYRYTLSAADADGDGLTYVLEQAPSGMSIHVQTGLLSWTPTELQVGSHSVRVSVRDAKGGIAYGQWSVHVQNTNDPPRIVSKPTSLVRVGQKFEYAFVVSDPDRVTQTQERWTYVLQNAPQGMHLDAKTSIVSWSPTERDIGLHTIQLRVVDRAGLSDVQWFQLRVLPDEIAPLIVSVPTQNATEHQLYRYSVRVSNVQSLRNVRFQLLQAPVGMQIDVHTGVIEWVPSNADARIGRYTIQVRVVHSGKKSAQQSYILHVANVNSPPEFLSMPCHAGGIGSYNCVLWVRDIDKGQHAPSVRKVLGPEGLRVEVGTEILNQRVSVSLKWEPTREQVGAHLVILEASDGQATTRMQFSILIRAQSGAPIAVVGNDRTVPPGEVVLDGRKSRDSKGNIEGLKYTWRQVQGPVQVQFPDPQRIQPRLLLRDAGSYVFELIVRKDGKQSTPSLVRISVVDTVPFASILAPKGGETGERIVLDGSYSDDANGETLLFRWQQIAGPTISLDKSDSSKPSFVPKEPGLYIFSLVVEEKTASPEKHASRPAKVEITVHKRTGDRGGLFVPHAVILAPSTGRVKTLLPLDGRRSRNLTAHSGNRELRYQWRVIDGPKDARISAPTLSKTSFEATLPGLYTLGLIVRNGQHRSAEARAQIFVGVKDAVLLPIANPRQAYATFEGWSTLDGSNSRDFSGRQLTYEWKQLLPFGGVPVALREARSGKPSFFALSRSPYRFQLKVSSQGHSSIPVSIDVLVNEKGNTPPVADAGQNRTHGRSVQAGQLVTLDGSGSREPDYPRQKIVGYRWKQTRGFPVFLREADTARPSFIPVTYGLLSFSLQVFDGQTWSYPAHVYVAVNDENNHVPYADAGSDQKVLLGENVTLDGSKSTDADPRDTLTYQWTLLVPQGRTLPLNVLNPKFPVFTAKDPKINRYVFGLIVDDGKTRSLEDTVTIQVLDANQPPIARTELSGEPYLGEEIVLDGSKSSDADRDRLTFTWKQISGPSIPIEDPNRRSIQLHLKELGRYVFQLQVHDGFAFSAPSTVRFEVQERPASKGGCGGCQSSPSSPSLPRSFFLYLVFILGWMYLRKVHLKRKQAL